MKNRTNQQGFSLVELLVVVIIIAIIAAIAIPNLLASRRAANEASAISSLRTIHSAQVTYFSTTGANQDYGTLALLGPTTGAGLIDVALEGGSKSGYTIAASRPAATPFNLYCATASPQGTSGTRFFAVSIDGVIYQNTSAFTCTAGALTVAGSAIQ